MQTKAAWLAILSLAACKVEKRPNVLFSTRFDFGFIVIGFKIIVFAKTILLMKDYLLICIACSLKFRFPNCPQ